MTKLNTLKKLSSDEATKNIQDQFIEWAEKSKELFTLNNRVFLFYLSYLAEEYFNWQGVSQKIPEIYFENTWGIKLLPPSQTAVLRFEVKVPNVQSINVFLDCYNTLGDYPGPYWEIQCHNKAPVRIPMHDTKKVKQVIRDLILTD